MFSKKPAPAPHSAAGRTMANSTFSVFGADIRIKGDITASADLHIDGKIEGDVACTSLVQGESSEITGAVKAESATSVERMTESTTGPVGGVSMRMRSNCSRSAAISAFSFSEPSKSAGFCVFAPAGRTHTFVFSSR